MIHIDIEEVWSYICCGKAEDGMALLERATRIRLAPARMAVAMNIR
jgi:hypothetical protein